MANYSELKTLITNVIKTNGANAITGELLQQTLLSIVDVLGEGYTFGGVVDGAVIPSQTDAKIFFLAAGPGTYSNFGGLEVKPGEVAIFLIPTGGNAWRKMSVSTGSDSSIIALDLEDFTGSWADADARFFSQNYIERVILPLARFSPFIPFSLKLLQSGTSVDLGSDLPLVCRRRWASQVRLYFGYGFSGGTMVRMDLYTTQKKITVAMYTNP